jgi:tetratricopeptide (TPR) repeat protein
MVTRILKSTVFVLAVGCAALLPGRLLAQSAGAAGAGPGTAGAFGFPGAGGLGSIVERVDVDLYIQGPNGQPIEGAALVTLTRLNGEFFVQATAKAGYVRLNEVVPSEYNVLVVAPGFARTMKQIDASVQHRTLLKFTVQVQPATDGEDTITDLELVSLAPKAQKAIAKAIEALRNNKLPEARNQLETASRAAPKSAEVDYLFGVYSLQMKDRAEAKAYWTKALEVYPKHFRSLLSLSQALVDDGKLADALLYLDRAVRVEPSSWRAHAIYAEAYLLHGSADEAIQQAERALQLGRGEAVVVKRYLAAALAKRGEKDKAIDVLQKYVEERPADMAAKKQLENLQSFTVQNAPGAADAEMVQPGALADATALPLPSAWLPPDLDEKVPPVERGSVCTLDEVVQKAGQRIEEFVTNVDRFVATESVSHETINRSGLLSAPETRKFDYMVSIQEVRKGFFNVEEFRTVGNTFGEFPGGVDTNGLPAMVLIFHPYNVASFDLTCEGLARWNGGLAWQVHFRQRPDKPNTMRKYRLGAMGRSVPVALKGRAWIAADTYQVVRLETQMLAPVPEIHLAADSTVIEYGPVHFRERNMDMWLPQSADVYSDWRGRRFHRRHTFSKYLLSTVDDQQHISAPKTAEETPPKSASDAVKPNH